MTHVVRPALVADIPWVVEELAQLDQFFGAGRPLMPSPEFARERLTWMFEDHQTFLSLMVVDVDPVLRNERPLGFIISMFQQHFFNPEIIQCQSLLWWTTLKARGTVAGARLLEAWVDYARVKADWLVLVIQDKTPINEQGLFRRGFKLIDKKYLLEIPHAEHLPGVPL